MTDDTIKEVIAVVAEVLEIPVDELGFDSSMENIPTWDSFEQMDICLAFEKKFGISLDMQTIATSTNIRALAALVPQHYAERQVVA